MNTAEKAAAKAAHDAIAPKADADKTKEELIAELKELREKYGVIEPPAQPYQEYPKVLKKVKAATPHAPAVVTESVIVNSKEEEDKLGSGWEGPDENGHKPPVEPKPEK